MTVESTSAPARARVEQMLQLPEVLRRLQQCTAVPDLFATAAELVRWAGDYDWAVVLTVDRGQLSARECGVLEHPDSDVVRRRFLSAPIAVTPNSREARWLRFGTRQRDAGHEAPSVFEDLGHVGVGLIAPDAEVLAMVLARSARPIDPLVDAMTAGIAAMTSVVLARLVLTARLREATTALRHVAVSAEGLIEEVANAPIQIPTASSRGPTFIGLAATELPTERSLDVLTRRETDVAALLVEGRSDREIAQALVISINTAKDHVARIRRKLDASNRAEAAAKYVRLVQSGS